MLFHATGLAGAFTVEIEKRIDHRGFFARTFCAAEFGGQGLATGMVQMNISCSIEKGTLRGMHYQEAPYSEVKLVRCTRGAIYDVIIDMRDESETAYRWFGMELTAENYRMLYVPEGFAHGFLSLSDDTEVTYLVSQFFTPEAERGVRWNDPFFGIEWPHDAVVISEKDKAWPDFRRPEGSIGNIHLRGDKQI